MTPEQKCGNCKFFFDGPDGLGAGWCRSHPPRVSSPSEMTRWPAVGPDDWCGEWSRKMIPIRRPDLDAVRDPSGPS